MEMTEKTVRLQRFGQ